jgi:hypothetical protein
MSAVLWNDVKIDSLRRMSILYNILYPADELVQPIQKYGPMVTRVSYSFITPGDNRPHPNLPIVAFFNKDLFPNLVNLSLTGSPKWLESSQMEQIASSLSNSLTTLSLSSITKNNLTVNQFAKVSLNCVSNYL